MNPKTFFSEAEKRQIETAIVEAERLTSGEIRLHIDSRCRGEVLDCAVQHFHRLGMDKTELQNGVLFYLAIDDHRFAVIGDRGINERVPTDFWDNIYQTVVNYFRRGAFAEGLCWAIVEAGQQLSTHFPIQPDDTNELTNEISFES
ncbi:MAG: TPM domain-containing protein [Prevotellaceae bacterium]|jgi:uncharacterized membrane protein|nr:TPM domain-containing protein [Prevotellaceae bacterium]